MFLSCHTLTCKNHFGSAYVKLSFYLHFEGKTFLRAFVIALNFSANCFSRKRTQWLECKKGLVFLKMVFCYQNCSDPLWEKIVLVIEKTLEIRGWRPRICKNFEITRTIYSNRTHQNNYWQQNAFLICSWSFLISNKLEQLEFKLEKNIGI